MTNRQARIFAIASTGIAALIFLTLTVDSHRQFPKLTHSENITPAVIAGKDVWHENNCVNCHTLFGEGAYYAPDLTKIAKHRGEPYLRAYLRDPSQFYDESKHRRLMPKQDLSEDDISNLIAFLEWISQVDNQGWPPRPILVTGVMVSPSGETAARSQAGKPVDTSDDPVALGQNLFNTVVPACSACHSTSPGVNMVGPSLAGIAERAEKRIASPEYTGEATDVRGYIRESIAHPSAYVVPGAMYSSGGTSFMPATYGEKLTSDQLDQLTAYLTSLK